ncbi:glycosyltransferase family 2 protein [Thalassobaculum sp.]|uniref:glycosyltransferase family 2 protein n=1 Tax=Thalassobaculum sp. TaxID=2022740 RepID=UPI0032ED7A3F
MDTVPEIMTAKDEASGTDRSGLSVVVPAYNEADNLDPLLARLTAALERIGLPFEVLVVDDRSTDATYERLSELNARDPRIKALRFSRNFGKEIALAAGLRHASGAAVVLMDADLQHPPELIETFVSEWRQGAQIVYGQRDRSGELPGLRRWLTRRFYRFFDAVGEVKLMRHGGDFALFDRRVVRALNALPERGRFGKGLYAWVGFRRVAVPFTPEARHAGHSRWSFWRLWMLALDAVTAFSVMPLRVWSYIGVLVSMLALLYGTFIAIRTLIEGVDVPGYASLMVAVAFFGGVQLITLGVLGEYVGRVFTEVKRRPLYIVDQSIGVDEVLEIGVAQDPARR